MAAARPPLREKIIKFNDLFIILPQLGCVCVLVSGLRVHTVVYRYTSNTTYIYSLKWGNQGRKEKTLLMFSVFTSYTRIIKSQKHFRFTRPPPCERKGRGSLAGSIERKKERKRRQVRLIDIKEDVNSLEILMDGPASFVPTRRPGRRHSFLWWF